MLLAKSWEPRFASGGSTRVYAGDRTVTSWLFCEVDDSGVGFPARIVLRPLKHSLSQDLEASSTIHLPLQEL